MIAQPADQSSVGRVRTVPYDLIKELAIGMAASLVLILRSRSSSPLPTAIGHDPELVDGRPIRLRHDRQLRARRRKHIGQLRPTLQQRQRIGAVYWPDLATVLGRGAHQRRSAP